jgi:hypothetical protein
MYSPTYAELKSALQKELDLEDETFITAQEFLNYFNEGVDVVEASIHTIYEDYFLTKGNLSLVNGTADYGLPSDIYAQKIRGMYYDDGSKKYDIKRVRKITDVKFVEQTDYYQYIITNTSASGLKITLYPTPAETNSYVTLWYIRNAKRFSADADVCDIPEFTHVIVQYVRWKCMSKEGHPDTPQALNDLERMKQEMVETLTARVPDEDYEITQDMSFYNDFDDYRFGGMF